MKILKFYRDFQDFVRVRNNFELTSLYENEELLTYMVNRYNEEKEEEINNLILNPIVRSMVIDGVSPEYVKGYMDSLDYRLRLLRNNRKLKITK